MATSDQDISDELQESISTILKPKKVEFMKKVKVTTKLKSEEKILALTLWRAFVLPVRIPAKVESSFNYLEINAINTIDLNQIVIETEKISYSFKLMSLEDLEQVVSHVTASLKKIFPDSSPGKLLKKNTHELQERIWKITASLEDLKDSNQGPCGGYSETYTALCDYNGFPCKEEIQWDVDTIYHSQDTKEFNLLDFSHLDSRDVALCVAALAFNQWFIKLYSKDLRLNPDVVEQILYMLSMSSKLEEVVLENAGLKFDFGQKMALALEENPCPGIHTINLSSNQLEDRGMSALSQQIEKLSKGLKHLNISRTSLSAKGLNSLAQSFLSNDSFASSLVYLDLSGNPGLLAAEDTCSFYSFLAQPNALSHLDLAGTDCALDALFGALDRGCCMHLSSLILNRNVYSHKKVREIPPSLKHFFRNCWSLKYVGLSGTKLPLEALRAVLQGLACNTHVSDVQLDLSNCELRSAGAQVIQDHIFDAKAISNLDLTDNGFDSDMVTLVLSLGRSKSLQHVSLGKNFNIKSKALVDVLHRIVQLIQDEECPLRSLSVADSRLKSGTCILINALGSNTCLRRIDISGNAMGDTGAKMLAKALQINTSLRTVAWDRNHTTAVGFLDVASALERNYTLKSMPLPMSDVAQAYRNNPEKTEEALQKIQSYLLRNNQMRTFPPEQALRLEEGIVTSSTQQMVDIMCDKVQEHLNIINKGPVKELQEDLTFAEETIKDAKMLTTILPALYQRGISLPCESSMRSRLESVADDISQAANMEIETLVQSLLDSTKSLCPNTLQKASVQEQLVNPVLSKISIPQNFVKSAIIEQAGLEIVNKLREVKLSITAAFIDRTVEHTLKELITAQQKLAHHLPKPGFGFSAPDEASSESLGDETMVKGSEPLLAAAQRLAPVESASTLRRKTIHSRRIRPTAALKRVSEFNLERQVEEMDCLAEKQLLSVSGRPMSHPACVEIAFPVPPLTGSFTNLPTEGQKLEHYTRGRPKPNRTKRQPPSKPVVQPTNHENEDQETISTLDEGLEEFFTNKTTHGKYCKNQPTKRAEHNIPPRSKNKFLKFSDFFAFKISKFTKPQKSDKEPEGKPPRSKSPAPELLRPRRKSGEAQVQATPHEGATPQASERTRLSTMQDVCRPRSPRAAKAQSLILLPGMKQSEALSMQLSVPSEQELNLEPYIGNELSQSDLRIHTVLHRTGAKVMPINPKSKLNTDSESGGTNYYEVSAEKKTQPPSRAMKLSALANMDEPSTVRDADDEDSETTSLREAKVGEVSSDKRSEGSQMVSEGRQQRILLPPHRKLLRPRAMDRRSSPSPLPRKLAGSEKSFSLSVNGSPEEHRNHQNKIHPPSEDPSSGSDETEESNVSQASHTAATCGEHTVELWPSEILNNQEGSL
ncbi:capping protein, Arp2/3 and myosin-I linker protein 2 [Callorhinchus milii]|uniref:capping protein, Arp2/3 and myosin-I linker protein 2 n=1 Tax=Callorhinchus milii TaxID=7868 RepID=UPI0004573DB9|nr:capping protein, Arp2/3 and myosin-I linker protein 2 [Callorhinchus milii]|eukprot:gi/632944954/ref/XP_007887782.1/ PREDICTED: leucine-rich repeat-containing protein 16C [Callorhinchus milii]